MRRIQWYCALTVVLFPASAFAQDEYSTVLDGVYSSAQAQRGARTYANICAHCHEGGEPDADPLFGPEFIDRWREAPLSFLHGFFSANMPADEPGTLAPGIYLDTLAFLLRENGYPAGRELTPAALDTTMLVGMAGPQPLPLSALVSVSGCLQDDGSLATASELSRIRRANAASPEELKLALALEPGSASYRVRNADTALAGQIVLVKGVLAAIDTINALELATTETNCTIHSP